MPASPQRDSYLEGLELSAANRHFEAIERFEEALARCPDDIRVLFALGNTANVLGMAETAEVLFRQVLAFEPDRLEALVNLANLLRAQGQLEAAESLLRPALARNGASPELWLTLGSVLREKGDNAGAARHYREALNLRPDYGLALGNLADILSDDGDTRAAISLYDLVIAREPLNAQAKLNRAVLHLLIGDLANGWSDYAARKAVPGKVPVSDHRLPAWNGEFSRGQRVIVRVEQGVGDQIMFASLVPELAARAARAGATVLLECDPRLATLFSRSFPGAEVRAVHIEARAGVVTATCDRSKAEERADAEILLGSLPQHFRRELCQFPNQHRYLLPDRDETLRWQDYFKAAGKKPRIGICWRSGAKGGGRAVQYANLHEWARFIRLIPGTVISAQYDASQEELYELEKLSGRKVVLPRDLNQKTELDRTAAMFAALDAVVTAPTAVSWLAAGIGVTTFKILFDTSWTSFGQPHEPFAPAAQLIMPKKRGDWSDVFAQAAEKISGLHCGA